MKFQDILGNKKIINQLINTIENDRASQSYIFEGTDGIGKTTVAKLFGMGLLCSSFDKNPCEHCSNCSKILSSNHPDIYHLFTDGASIKTKQIEQLQEFIISKPFLANKKIIFIHDADKMTISAQNKLLKTLEEPAGNTIIILITNNINILLPTIRSRCQTISFQRLSISEISHILVDKFNLEEHMALSHATLADGSVGIAIRNIEDEEFANFQKLCIDFLNAAIFSKTSDMLTLSDLIAEHKEQLESAFMIMKLWIRDIVFLSLKLDKNIASNFNHDQQLDNIVKACQTNQLINIIERIEQARQQHKSYVQPALILESLGLNIQEDIDGNSYRSPF